MNEIINLDIEQKIYKKRTSSVTLLQNFSLNVQEGEKIAIVGESGAGKSTLLNILGLIDRDYIGTYHLSGRFVAGLSDRELAAARNQKIGFVLQESALINSLSLADNIKLPFLYARESKRHLSERFDEVVTALRINSILGKKPLDCSGGEKARAVFARAIVMNPELVLADEPTASLDVENRDRIMELIFKLNEENGATIITVTHDLYVAQQHDRAITLQRKEI
ncbi:ABC transporter ATP-binding protein [Schaalia sp. lx-100]|uniref:ABC transporter ATP-binding protein n=1 Tax=Schaalia sp. lx-100 TaxID=2899081 RepID=UPI001E2C75D9|nr:ATP-binding cassette domain-containing protein [Schaalia sp. lx-100]MCD4557722.1 ATP-binding cassette domain-containing protein [Schaalia sp. lx-100]